MLNTEESFNVTDDQQYVQCQFCTTTTSPPNFGYFNIGDMNIDDSPNILDRRFRQVKDYLKKHLKKAKHRRNTSQLFNDSCKSRITDIGTKLSMIAYDVMYTGESFTSFERRVTIAIGSKVDLGNVNHSELFFRNYMTSVYNVLTRQVVKFLSTKVKCTGRPPLVCIKPDKFTKKGRSNQAVVIRHVSIQDGKLFRETYVGHDDADIIRGDGLNLTKLMLSTLKKLLGDGDEAQVSLCTVRDLIGAVACDGAYISLNISKHIASELKLPISFMEEATSWDFAHKLERADLHTSEQHQWVADMNIRIKAFMDAHKDHKPRLDLKEMCEKMSIPFLEFVSFSDTRFAQYRHRTYDVFLKLYPALYRYVERFFHYNFRSKY